MTDLRLPPAPRPAPEPPSLADPGPSEPAPPSTSLGAATSELCDSLAEAVAAERLDDVRLCDAMESLTLVLWSEALRHVGLPAWAAMPSPRHRWVVLERAAWRLARRVGEAGIGGLPAGAAADTHLARVRALLAKGPSRAVQLG